MECRKVVIGAPMAARRTHFGRHDMSLKFFVLGGDKVGIFMDLRAARFGFVQEGNDELKFRNTSLQGAPLYEAEGGIALVMKRFVKCFSKRHVGKQKSCGVVKKDTKDIKIQGGFFNDVECYYDCERL